ncbi:hypothetical protein BDY19DRAFT_899806, partial [Irpex rosettiformis]
MNQEVNELLYLSNIHECSKKNCLDNKYKTCKARFPRDVHKQTTVDSKSGALILRKGEAWLNTFTPTLTYLLRCNTDVTSLLSGTAIKSVVAYITDYITKSPLKTHIIFDAVKTIFAKNMEELAEDEDKLKKGRSVITKIVNSLTAKSEIGSPMASMYLLNHNDHYTSHKFQKFYWRPYVYEVKTDWKSQNTDSRISPILDYIYRPKKYENVSLYDWIRMANKIKIRQNKNYQRMNGSETDSNSEIDSDCELELNHENFVKNKSDIKQKDENYHNIYKNDLTNTDYHRYDNFLIDHPQYNTHKVCLLTENKAKVPDFIGGALPRYDSGNQEEYCMTMLIFFRPWRKGRDLKTEANTWCEEFKQYNFTNKEHNIMKYFNLRYECNDARDDYAAQRRAQKNPNNDWPYYLDHQTTEWLDKHDKNISLELSDNFDTNEYLESALSSLRRMSEIEELAQKLGLLD